MTESQTLAASNFINYYRQQFPPQVKYHLDFSGQTITATSTDNFIRSRQEIMAQLFVSSQDPRFHMCHALGSEQLVKLALIPLVDHNGFCSHLAPQTLERGSYHQKGVDLLITDSDNFVYLGIDVKLRKGKSKRQRDGYGWNPSLNAPYIYLSLGNWLADTRQGPLPIRQWLTTCVCPHILSSGKIPHLDQFRTYLVDRIEKSINGYIEAITHPYSRPPFFGIPQTRQDFDILSQKLTVMQSLFSDLKLN